MASKNETKTPKGKLMSGVEIASKQSFDFSVDFFAALGLFGLYISSMIKESLKSFYKKYLKRYVFKLDAFGLKVVKFFSKISRAFMFKFYMFAKFFVSARNVIVKGYHSHENVSVTKKLFYASKAFFKGVKNNKHIFITTLNYALPVVAISMFASLVSFVSSLNFAVAVEYNGEHVGYVANESVFESAETKLQERMIYLEGDEAIDNIPKFTVAVVEDQPLKTDAEMTDTIIQSSAGDIVKATGLNIDGKFYGAVKDGETLKTELDQILDEYRTNTEGEEVAFAKDVKTEPGLFLAKNIVDETEVMAKVTTQEQKDVYYEVVEGDTPIIIAAKNEMSLDDVLALNGDLLKNCPIGKQVLVKKSQAFLPVKVTRTETYTQEVPFETTVTESNKLYKGRQQITKAGVKGKEVVSAKVEYVDGYEVGRTVVSSTRISEPVEQVIAKGTLELPKGNITSGKVSGYGFMWPVKGGYISQGYGGRNRHNGIDYAYRGNGYGQPIYASMDGKVVFSGTNGS
ncbi:MAG: G5 domain-containing protein, partial [Oscillospiraceae bacterium]